MLGAISRYFTHISLFNPYSHSIVYDHYSLYRCTQRSSDTCPINITQLVSSRGFPGGSVINNLAAKQEIQPQSLVGSLVGYSPRGCKELDMTQQLTSSSQQQRQDMNSSSITLLNHYIAFISNIYDILANNHTV